MSVRPALHGRNWQKFQASWNMLINGQFYDDPGSDYVTRIKPDPTKNRALQQLRQLGFDVTLTEVQSAVA